MSCRGLPIKPGRVGAMAYGQNGEGAAARIAARNALHGAVICVSNLNNRRRTLLLGGAVDRILAFKNKDFETVDLSRK